ncbi:hypothetical protein B0T17DRAFT_535550 [Bombardia bombarda]|uniref:Uncharacterized protein n=1 Tax=Bombardia bombarda TaxID=252184 RepID=A0AA40C1J2_9PEZI|nr:hypothetical protein B0T17DRAFT_535550 [Bombardia bombarda]
MSIINGLRNCVNQVGKGNDSRTFGNGNTTNQLGHGGNFGQSSGEDKCSLMYRFTT